MEFFRLFIRVLKLGRSEWRLCVLLIIGGIGVATAQIFEPVLFGRVIDSLAKENGFARYVLVWAGLGILNACLSIFLAIASDRFAHRQRLRAMGLAFERAISTPYQTHAREGSGKVVRTIVAGSDQVFHISLSFLRENVIAFGSVLIPIPMAFAIEPRLASALFVLTFVYGCCNWFIIRRTHARQMRVETKHQELASRLVDVIGNVPVVRGFTRVAREVGYFREKMNEVLKDQYPVLNYWGVLNVITRLSSMTAMVTIVAIGSTLVHAGTVTSGQVVTFVGFSGLLIGRLDQITGFLNRIVGQVPSLNHLFDLIDHGETTDRVRTRTLSPHTKGRVVFENVTFEYGDTGHGIHNFNFEIEPGQTVALVGPSGAGKTTCLALLQRLYSPKVGRILIDGHDIDDLDVNSLCGAIATVFQEPGLFNRSIYENILVGRPTATREEVEAAAMRAEAHDFTMAHSGGYDFIVGERGLALSAGERQRIAIARAILKDAPILILDEATSALDNETERKIQAAMERLSEGKTTFMIAHRLSTIRSADRILVISDGRIMQSGTFEQLRAAPGLFARLLRSGQMFEEPQHEGATRVRESTGSSAVGNV